MRIRVHLNLHKAELAWRSEPFSKGKLTYTKAICLKDCVMVVSEKRRLACLAGHIREVHAWIEGNLCNCGNHSGLDITYNPHRDLGFVQVNSDKLVTSASHVSLRMIDGKPSTKAGNPTFKN